MTHAAPPPSTPARPASVDEPPTIGSFRGSPTIRLTPGREAEQMQAAVEAIHRHADAAERCVAFVRQLSEMKTCQGTMSHTDGRRTWFDGFVKDGMPWPA